MDLDRYFKLLAQKDFRCDLGPMREWCSLLGNPQDAYATIHIAGTNGKGSTSVFLSNLLQAAGYRVGLMTSPHLIDISERIQINGTPISPEALTEQVEEIRDFLPDETYLSYFEMITLVGFEYFSRMEVDVAVVETGLGGRLDATNVVMPQIALLTPIAFDHENILGDTLAKIAREKCGILKEKIRAVISAPQEQEAAKVIEASCKKLKLPLHWADPSAMTMPLGLKGDHQKINAACAWLAMKTLLEEELSEQKYLSALEKTFWPGRLQILSHNPSVLVDGAHNRAGIETLAQYLKTDHSHQKIHFLIGCLKDKNWEGMFAPLKDLGERFICVNVPSTRGLSAAALEAVFKNYGKAVSARKEPVFKVFQGILAELPPHDLLVATGSLYMIGEILKSF